MKDEVFDFSYLRGKIREKFGTEANFAKALGVRTSYLSDKLNNKSSISCKMANKMIEVLDINCENDEIKKLFFTLKVRENAN